MFLLLLVACVGDDNSDLGDGAVADEGHLKDDHEDHRLDIDNGADHVGARGDDVTEWS